MFFVDPKEEKEEEDSTFSQEVSIAASRPSRGWRSSSRTSVSRHRDTENTRSSRSKTGSLPFICKSEPNTDQLDYGTLQIQSLLTKYLLGIFSCGRVFYLGGYLFCFSF